MKPFLIFISAGEASGDLIGSNLMKDLRLKLQDNVRFVGIGGPLMEAEGLASLFSITELSVMGIVEVLPRIFKIRHRIQETVAAIQDLSPDVVITIDSPGFHNQVAKKLKQAQFNSPIVHYVAPSVWAWRPKRAKKLAKLVDHLLCLFPFEPPYFEKENLLTTFVGHPIAQWKPNDYKQTGFRKKHSIPGNAQIITVLPGSRQSEITYLLPIFLKTLLLLKKSKRTFHVIIPTLHHLVDKIKEAIRPLNLPITVVTAEEDRKQAYVYSTIALAASGTIALELAAFSLPCVIAYKMNAITYALVRRLVYTPYACLVNILLKKKVIQEFIQDQCTPEALAGSLNHLLDDKDARDYIKEHMKEAIHHLNAPPYKAAETIMEHFLTTKDLSHE